jgi:hypothetical protein
MNLNIFIRVQTFQKWRMRNFIVKFTQRLKIRPLVWGVVALMPGVSRACCRLGGTAGGYCVQFCRDLIYKTCACTKYTPKWHV